MVTLASRLKAPVSTSTRTIRSAPVSAMKSSRDAPSMLMCDGTPGTRVSARPV